MGILDLLQVSVEPLKWLSHQFVLLGIESGDAKAARLGSSLFVLTMTLDGYAHRNANIEVVLDLLDKACSWPRAKTNDKRTLRMLSATKLSTRTPLSKLEKEVCNSLKLFFAQSPEVEILLQLIEECDTAKVGRLADQKAADSIAQNVESDPGYPQRINNLLYSCLRMQTMCSCSAPHLGRARLRLESDYAHYNGDAIEFEMLFCISSVPNSDGTDFLWQETRIIVPRKDQAKSSRKHPKKSRARFTDQSPQSCSSVAVNSSEKLKKLAPGEFCSSMSNRGSCRLSFRIHEGSLKRSESSDDFARRNVRSVGDCSLSQLLENARYMPKRLKVVFAYNIAKSVWQYYSSSWMSSPWTNKNIHFVEEQDHGNSTYVPHPYFEAHFVKHQVGHNEYFAATDLMFQYPNVLALGILLIEIATLKPFKIDDSSSQWDETGINDYFEWAWTTAAKSDLKSLVCEEYAGVVASCLDADLFKDAPFDKNDPELNLEARQAIIYTKIVSPLNNMVNAWSSAWEMSEIQRNHKFHNQPSPDRPGQRAIHGSLKEPLSITVDPIFLAADQLGTGRWSPTYWLNQIDSINQGLIELAKDSPQSTPIKIAILDTGCNLNAEFFDSYTGDEDRLKGRWHDWVDDKPMLVDEHGHGTALVTLLLRMVRNAEIFVARVAKNAQDLNGSEENIAKAIIHAAGQWNVDIISMSFGFPNEIESIKRAMRQAESIKGSSIVFFAAAANDGANSQEMFPASMESVISVRATNSNGSFVSTYDPPPSAVNEESRLYGTLGENVPYDWANERLVKSGCSLATPIMVGISALIMEYCGYKATKFEERENIQEHIRSRRGIIQIFKEISVRKGNQRFYVAPWDFFQREEEIRLATVRNAIGKLPRQQPRR